MALQIVFDYFYKTLPANDILYGSIKSLMLSATPLTTSALEIIPIINLLTGDTMKQSELFKTIDGVDQLTSVGASKIRKSIAGKISYIMDDNPKEYPSSSFEGNTIKGIDYIRFIRTTPIDHQLNCFKYWREKSSTTDERGNNMIKDIAFPAIKEYPHGVIFSKNISDLSELPNATAVTRTPDGWSSSNIYKLKELGKYSCKYAQLVKMCLDMKDTTHGKLFIYHPFVQGSGTDLIVSILHMNGFVLDGDQCVKNSICMHCDVTYGSHQSIKDHIFNPVQFTFVTGSLSKTVVASRLNSFNNDQNTLGEKLKIIVGSRAMRESHTLKACRHVIITHEPSSISEMVQIIGRAVRKNVHNGLPQAMRTVKIHILTTNVDSIKSLYNDSTSNEEFAYRMKVLQYKQINHIDRIMYDVAIDYLINFRFKLRETPQLLGESYPLDEKSYKEYEKTLTNAYSNLRNGIAPHGIHTNRFNIFYFEGEVSLVSMIIKRILLDYQPVISIAKLRELVRSPPFHVEYNTRLISDESLAVAISKISFRNDQLRFHFPISETTTVDSLFDQSSTIIDSHGIEYKIVCIGDPLCLDSYLAKRSIVSIAEGDQCVIDSFRQLYSANVNAPIDLQELSARWASTIDVNDIIEDVKVEWFEGNKKEIDNLLSQMPIGTHCTLAEWLIKYATSLALRNQKQKNIDVEMVKYLLDFYQSKRLIFTVADLKRTKVYDRYKKYNVNTGASWFSKTTKPSTSTLPVGHTIGTLIRLFQPSEMGWLEIPSISYGDINHKHPYGFYIYEERIDKTLNVALKVKILKDEKSKGITMTFLQTQDIENIAKKLKVDISKLKYKIEMISKIENAAWAIQNKLYPDRVIYKLIDM